MYDIYNIYVLKDKFTPNLRWANQQQQLFFFSLWEHKQT